MQFVDEAGYLFPKGFTGVFDFLSTDVTTGREDVAVRGDFGGSGGFAEARDVFVLARVVVATPGVVGAGNFGDVGFGQFTVDAVNQRTEFAGVDEEGLFTAVAAPAIVFVFREKPEADGNLCGVEKLAR